MRRGSPAQWFCSGRVRLVLPDDPHNCSYGAFGTFATGMGATDVAVVYATGKTWFMVPGAFQIEVDGILREHVTAKDLILHIIGSIGSYGAT